MNFTKITDNTTCNCFGGAVENTTDTFVRKVRRSAELKDADFKNHIERDKTASNQHDCDEVCGLHGISIEIWNEKSSAPLMEKYITTASFSPKAKKNLCVIKFLPNSGLVKHTPEQKEFNEFHYDFYKEDSFLVSNLELVDMIQITAP